MFIPCTYAIIRDDTPTQVSGYRYKDSGLGYHIVQFPDHTDPEYRYIDRYIIDHIASGHRLLYKKWLYTSQQAETFIQRVALLLPWNESKDILEALSKDEQRQVVNVINDTYWQVLHEHQRIPMEQIGRALCLIAQEIEVEEKKPSHRRELCSAYRDEVLAYASVPKMFYKESGTLL